MFVTSRRWTQTPTNLSATRVKYQDDGLIHPRQRQFVSYSVDDFVGGDLVLCFSFGQEPVLFSLVDWRCFFCISHSTIRLVNLPKLQMVDFKTVGWNFGQNRSFLISFATFESRVDILLTTKFSHQFTNLLFASLAFQNDEQRLRKTNRRFWP